jgi:serine/threonine protein kinase
MSYCLNPNCPRPQNPSPNRFCQNCGTKLLLKDRYQAIQLIGQGGFGRTFLAVDRDRPAQRNCTIKQLFYQAQNAQKASELFAQEAIRLNELGIHPQIPQLLAYFTQDNQQYLVQEFISGQNLAQILASEGTFKENQIRDLLHNLLPVLEFVHSRQVIHRDIKPENIIQRVDRELILVDFGAAKFATGTALAKTGTTIGSAEFVAPEQARGKAVFASDLYSLGVTCIYLLTGISPFELYDLGENKWIWRDYLVDNPVSDRLGNILDQMIANAINHRYQTATEIIQNLSGKLPPLSPNAPPVSLPPTPSLQTWQCTQTLVGHEDFLFAGIQQIAISPRGNLIASASEDCTIKLWNLTAGKIVHTFLGHPAFVYAVTFSPNEQIVVSGDYNGAIKIWDIITGKEIATLLGSESVINSLVISPDGRILASGSHQKINLWDLKTKKLIYTFADLDNVSEVVFSPNGKLIFSAVSTQIKIWDIKTGQVIKTLVGHDFTINTVTISLDGKLLATGDNCNQVKLWDLPAEKILHSLSGHKGWFHNGVNAVAFSPDSQILASSGGDRTIKLWQVSDGILLDSLTGHSKGVTSVAFSPDGQILASGSMDKTVKIWQRPS